MRVAFLALMMHVLWGTKQSDSILLFFYPTKGARLISSCKHSSKSCFYLKADKNSKKIIIFCFTPRYILNTHTTFKNCNIFQQIQIFFKTITKKQRIFILNDKQEQEIKN